MACEGKHVVRDGNTNVRGWHNHRDGYSPGDHKRSANMRIPIGGNDMRYDDITETEDWRPDYTPMELRNSAQLLIAWATRLMAEAEWMEQRAREQEQR